jgi:hypothetical protein
MGGARTRRPPTAGPGDVEGDSMRGSVTGRICGLVILLLATAGPAGAPSAAASTAAGTLLPATDPQLTFEGHWGRLGGAEITPNSGSRLLFRFTGHSLHLLFDTSTITVPAQIYVSIDGGSPQLYKVDHDDLDVTPTPLAGLIHSAEVAVKDVDEYENRWVPPMQSGVVFTGLRLDPYAFLVGKPRLGPLHLEFYGDSITEGVLALCPSLGVNCADGTKDYAYLTGLAFHADVNQVGFGKQGVIQPGHGDVGTAAQSFGWNFQGSPADPRFRPNAIVVNEGTNDGTYDSAAFRTAYLAYLREIRAADPHSWIFAMRPFGGYHDTDIAWAVDQLADPHLVYVDTTGWLSVAAGDFDGTTHPNVQGHRKAAARLISVIEATTGWRADPDAAGR